MSERTILQAKSVVKDYRGAGGRLRVLHGVSMSVRTGEFVIIVGASGAGKSTLMHILGLLDAPSTGEVFLRGDNVASLSGAERARIRNREFGFVFQFFHLLPDFTALENVTLPAMVGSGVLRWHARKRALLARAGNLLERVGLGQRLKHRPNQLSGGERQRVAIARALMNEPGVLFLDEPTGNLDTKTGESIFDLIHELNTGHDQTIVMVTHNESFARRGNRILRIVDGKFV